MFSRTPRRIVSYVFAAILLAMMSMPAAALAAPPAGCTVGGEAYGAAITGSGLVSVSLAKVADVVLPPGGTKSVASVGTILTLAGRNISLLSTKVITDTSTDTSTPTQASATSTSTVNNLSVVDGLITATVIKSQANSAINGSTTESDANGTTFTNLVIAGQTISANVAPNTTINVDTTITINFVPIHVTGTVVVNEQTGTSTGNGVSPASTNITVNALDVNLTFSVGGTALSSEHIIIASAATNASCTTIPAAAPSCQLTAVNPGTPPQLVISFQDSSSGLASIATVPAGTTNATVGIPTFTSGTTATVNVTAQRANASLPGTVELIATDVAGHSTTCDPVISSIVGASSKSVQRFSNLPAAENKVTILNDNPGLSSLLLLVQPSAGVPSVVRVQGLRSGETRVVDLSSALGNSDKYSILVVGYGQRNSSADVIIGN